MLAGKTGKNILMMKQVSVVCCRRFKTLLGIVVADLKIYLFQD